MYATTPAEARFGEIPTDARAVADAYLGRNRQRDIEAIARLITVVNPERERYAGPLTQPATKPCNRRRPLDA